MTGRAEQDHVLAGVQEVELPEVLDHRLLDGALEGEVELLQRLSGGEPGALIRPSPPWLSRAETSVASRALGEALIAPGLLPGPVGQAGQRLAAAGAFSARNRCASSDVAPLMRSARRSGQGTCWTSTWCRCGDARAGAQLGLMRGVDDRQTREDPACVERRARPCPGPSR